MADKIILDSTLRPRVFDEQMNIENRRVASISVRKS
jgi:hypothetical protein